MKPLLLVTFIISGKNEPNAQKWAKICNKTLSLVAKFCKRY